MLAVVYGCMGLILMPFFALAAMLGAFAQHAQSDQAGPAAVVGGLLLGMGIFMPIIYATMGFIFGVVGAALYNLVAHWIGGFEVEVE